MPNNLLREVKESGDPVKEIAEENFSKWNDALKTLDSEKVSDLYDPSASLLPTLSSEFKTNKETIQEYFDHFLQKKPVGEIVEQEIKSISPDCYLHSGLYNFEIESKDKKQTIQARFSYVWQKNFNEEWKIIHHHSSLKPE